MEAIEVNRPYLPASATVGSGDSPERPKPELRPVLNFIDGKGDHCWKRLRGVDCRDLRRAREP